MRIGLSLFHTRKVFDTMALKLLSEPAVEPISLAETKVHLRVDASDEDAFIASLITTARLQVETALNLALITQQQQWLADHWPAGGILELPVRPLQSVDAIRVYDSEDVVRLLDPTSYTVDRASDVPRIALSTEDRLNPGVPLNGIEIDVTVGFGATENDVPRNIRQALLLLTAFWFEHRDPVNAGHVQSLPEAVSGLLEPYRIVRL